MFASLFTRFIAPYLMQAAIGAGVLLAASGALWLYGHHKFNEGYAQHEAEIAAQNKGAADAAGKARSRVDDCYIGGGVWSQHAGECQRRP